MPLHDAHLPRSDAGNDAGDDTGNGVRGERSSAMHYGAASKRSQGAGAWARHLLLSTVALTGSGCVTSSMWEEWPDHHSNGRLDWDDGGTVAAIALTPVTVAVDAALIVSVVWLIVADASCGCGDGFEIDFD
ncbi:MAG: hypothetical protein JNL90_19030 [Planctomycetes bacterium]|nr:hypothetical protein [Planctomycetota bacterium]